MQEKFSGPVPVNCLHGHAQVGKRTRAYSIWSSMRNRCANPKNRSWNRYGGRGIKVCQRWQTFANFLEDMGEPPSPKHQLERIDNAGNYEPGNCRWATPKEQANNRRSSNLLTYQGKTQTLAAWCEELGLKHSTVVMRLTRYHWSVTKALSTPAREWSPGKPKKRT
jgi:hypothetical protein